MASRSLPRNNRLCTVEGCDERMKAQGFCEPHYQRWKRHGDPLGGNATPNKPTPAHWGDPCIVPGCGRPIISQRLCSAHYNRQLKYGHPQIDIPIKEKSPLSPTRQKDLTCSADGCIKSATNGGFCRAHYERMKKYGDPLGGGAFRKAWAEQVKLPCSVEGCERPAESRGLCPGHYARWHRLGDALHGGPALQRQNIAGPRADLNGYILWKDMSHPQASANGTVLQHRVVMSEQIGRPLKPSESVHHRNGKRDDNRIENLELWTSMQPSGQRPLDLIAYAREILAMYPPEIEAKLVEMKQRSEADPEFARPAALTCEAEE
jgi:hypothetical protein